MKIDEIPMRWIDRLQVSLMKLSFIPVILFILNQNEVVCYIE
jgi:hypothetical protein